MASLGTAYVQIVPTAQGISGSITNAISPESKAAGTSAGRNIAAGIGTSLKSVGGGMIKAGGIATALAVPLVAGIKKSLSAYNVQAAAETKLTEIYKTRMGVSDQAAKKTMELASALQKQGVIGDEVNIAGAQQLATFAKYPDTVNKLLPAMDNLLVQQKGVNASTGDATNIANLMGKVMNGQVGALKRVGITFDENSEKILKNGTEQEKAAELAKVITQNVGNMNEAFAQTNEGKMKQMTNAVGDLQEKLGGALAPVLADIATFISDNIVPAVDGFLTTLQGNPVLSRIIVGITAVLAIGGPLLAIIGMIVSGIGGLIGAVAAISAPVLGIVAIVAGVVAVLMIAYQRSQAFRNALQSAASAIASAVMPVIQQFIEVGKLLVGALVELIATIGSGLAPVIEFLTPIITTLVSIVGGIMVAALTHVVTAVKKFTAVLQAVGKVVGPPFKAMSKTVSSVCKTIAQALTFANIKAKVTGVFNGIKTKIGTVMGNIRTKVSTIVKAVKKFLGFSGVAGKVMSTFKSIKEKIEGPIKKARDTVKGVVDKIKGFFPLKVGKIFSNLKIPTINVSAGSPPFGIGGKGKKPSFSVSWHAKAANNPYLFSNATLFGAGETTDEILYGKNRLMNDIKDAVGGGRNVTINNTINVNGAENPEVFAQRFVRKLELEMRTA